MGGWPEVVDERTTLQLAVAGKSLSRFGDGELALALGKGAAISQKADRKLTAELRTILNVPDSRCLVCLPNLKKTTRRFWDQFDRREYVSLFGLPQGAYGSAFISRPDSAPWIDADDYWTSVRDLWAGRHVVLVAGSDNSLTGDTLRESARSVRVVEGPARDAYASIDDLERRILELQPFDCVILCLGATATVLAWRFAAKGVHALDLGHIGWFMQHQGLYRIGLADLCSPTHQKLLQARHAAGRWRNDGHRFGDAVLAFARQLGAPNVLDYGCGAGSLRKKLVREADLKITEYDPGVPGKDDVPKPVDVVACIDVLQHVEPDRVSTILSHIRLLAGRGAYLNIGIAGPADRQDATLKEPAWWLSVLEAQTWRSMTTRVDETSGTLEVRLVKGRS